MGNIFLKQHVPVRKSSTKYFKSGL